MRHPALLLALLAFLSASRARADIWDMPSTTTYLNMGPLLSASKRPSQDMFGFGLEASVHHFLDDDYQTGAGLFGQWQETSADHHRFAGGVQLSYLVFGVELGVAHETSNSRFASTTSLHVAPFLSAAGVATLSVRVGIPLTGSDGFKPSYGTDIGLVLAVKYPLALD